jgi:membrane dipeptidase
VFIVDAHEDIAMNALGHDRDVRRSVRRIRELEAAGMPCCCDPGDSIPETAMVGLPDLRRGDVGLVFSTIFVAPTDPDAMTAKAQAQLRYYQELAADGSIRLITSRAALHSLVADWHATTAPAERPVGFVLLMEGADPIREPTDLDSWYRQGLRILGTSWTRTRYAGGTRAPGPLTDRGRALLREMDRLGVILDVSHMAEESFWQALDLFSGPVIASHANCRSYVPTDRHLSDDMIHALAARDAVIGTVLANRFLVGGWTPESGEPVTLDAVVRHIDRICQLTGTARHCAIGSDFDGGFGVESTPDELDSVADLAQIANALERAGYRPDDVASIMGSNWLRLLERALPA